MTGAAWAVHAGRRRRHDKKEAPMTPASLSPFVRQFLAVSAGFLLGAASTCAVQATSDIVLDASVTIVVDHPATA